MLLLKHMEMNNWLEENKHFWWWVPNVKKLDEEAILEGVMNYGRWVDFLYLKEQFGLKKINKIFRYMTQEKKRVNLRPEKIALFTNYLNKYAS